MTDTRVFTSASNSSSLGSGGQTIVIQQAPGFWRSWATRLLIGALLTSIIVNFSLFAAFSEYFEALTPPQERFASGDENASDKIALLTVDGTIMPPFTERWLSQIERISKDNSVKGVLLVVDSPGGLVADSHEIYHRLKELSKKKPIFVQMKRIAASGGYYISMGAGPNAKIFAEPTTWTGSIGVIMPRYDASKLAEKIGVTSDPLKEGEFKDALSPFRELAGKERELWQNILNQSYMKFVRIIDENRDTLNEDEVKALANGLVYTADDAIANKLVDEIGYQEDSIDALKKQLKLSKVRVVKYHVPLSLLEQALGSAHAKQSVDPWRVMIEASVPRAMYLCSWLPALPE